MPSDATNLPDSGWRKSSFCYSGECVEVAALDGMILMRDSKDPRGTVLRYSPDEWRSFVRAVRRGASASL